MPDINGRRPVLGRNEKFKHDPNWNYLIAFHEYFHGDDGSGEGASHQTGWTGLIANLLQQSGEYAGHFRAEPEGPLVTTTLELAPRGV
jgi:hypothetical protein